MGVLAIWRYPVKAMLGELLESVEVTGGGLEGDRRWVVVDDGTGKRIANKRGPTDPRLRECRARIGLGGVLEVVLPDGRVVSGVAAIEPALSSLLGRAVRLIERNAGFRDFAPVHLVTTRTLAHLRSEVPESDWDERRFRPNLVMDDGESPGEFTEDALLGGALHGASGLRLDVELPTPRCVVPTRAREELPAHPKLLKEVAKRHRFDLGPLGRPVCVGAYADVARAGRVAVGERLRVTAGTASSPQAAATEAIQRVLARY